jgi:polyribonucleotide nucleotidyltransferase
MDFKVAEPRFVTGASSSTPKIDGLPPQVLKQALHQAKDAGCRSSTSWRVPICRSRDDVKGTAPKIISFEIPMDERSAR